MTQSHYFYFPFDIGDENETVTPKFPQEDIQKLANQKQSFYLKILGEDEPSPSLIKISQVASFMEDALDTELEWEFVGTNVYKSSNEDDKELIALLRMTESDSQNEDEPELHEFARTASPLFDYLLSQFSLHGLVTDDFWVKLHSLGIKETSNILYQLISIRDNTLLLDEDHQHHFDQTLESLEPELHSADSVLRSAMFSLLEDNSFTEARQVTILLELNYLFSLYISGLTRFDLSDPMWKIKSFLSSLSPGNVTKIDLPFLGENDLYNDSYYPF